MEAEIVLEPPLYFAGDDEHIWDLSFHPNSDFLACCNITGKVSILKYDSENVQPILTLTDLHKSSVRSCKFNSSGTLLASGGKDKRLGFVDSSGKIVHIQKKAHQQSISKVSFLNNETLVSGDDAGVVKIWDLRTSNCVFQVTQQSEAVTGFAFSEQHNFLLSSSLDGTLAVYDVRKGGINNPEKQSKALYALSDCMEEDLMGVEIMKNGKFVACNSSEGVILLFKWDWFGNCKDRIQGHPNSIDTMIKLNENTLITGSEDGFVRGVGIHPNKIVQVLGQHQQDQHFPVQKVDTSHCKKLLASCSHDNSIKFYDINDFVRKRFSKETMQLSDDEPQQEVYHRRQRESDFSQEDSDSDSDDNQMEEQKPKKKKKKRNKTNMKKRQGEIAKEKRSRFFGDL